MSLKSLSVDVNRGATSTCSWHTERERECESEKLIERKRGLGRERDKSRETEFGDREQQAGSWDLKRCRPYTQEVDSWSHLTLCYGCFSDLNCFPCDMCSDVHDVKSQHERDRKMCVKREGKIERPIRRESQKQGPRRPASWQPARPFAQPFQPS